jgi:hypothetical protein
MLARARFIFATIALITPNPAPGQEPSGRPYQYRTAVPAYRQLLRAHANAAGGVAVEHFRAAVIDPNREAFEAVAAGWLEEKNLEKYLRALDGRSEQAGRVDAEFPARFGRAWDRFAKAAPDLKPGATVFLLPAPRVAIGGSVRPLAGRDAVIFGTEEIGQVLDSRTGFDVLVHHELAHLYHMQVNPEVRRMIAEVYMPPYAVGRARMYEVLWLEGLAAYMSRALNPGAPDKEVLLSESVAPAVAASWPRIGAEIREHLDSSKKADIDLYLFDSDASGRIPRRTGYYVGMLIAEELAKESTFPELCRLAGPRLRAEVERALRRLEKAALSRR